MNSESLEILATPDWRTEKTPIERWISAFESQKLAVTVERESPTVCWLEVPMLRLKGYVLMQGLNVEAIDFEIYPNYEIPSRSAIEAAAEMLQWELDDEPFEDEDDS